VTKTYQKPTLVRRDTLVKLAAAVPIPSTLTKVIDD
jgi:hypothetical protein